MYVYTGRLGKYSVDNLMHITMNDKSLDYGEVADHWAKQKQRRINIIIIWILFESFSARLNAILVTFFLCQRYCYKCSGVFSFNFFENWEHYCIE